MCHKICYVQHQFCINSIVEKCNVVWERMPMYMYVTKWSKNIYMCIATQLSSPDNGAYIVDWIKNGFTNIVSSILWFGIFNVIIGIQMYFMWACVVPIFLYSEETPNDSSSEIYFDLVNFNCACVLFLGYLCEVFYIASFFNVGNVLCVSWAILWS